jgi:hypothetical protein
VSNAGDATIADNDGLGDDAAQALIDEIDMIGGPVYVYGN